MKWFPSYQVSSCFIIHTPLCLSTWADCYMKACKTKSKVNSAITIFPLNWLNIWFDYRTAHARLMFRDLVTVEDAVVAVTLMESTMQVINTPCITFCIQENICPCLVFAHLTSLSVGKFRTRWIPLSHNISL